MKLTEQQLKQMFRENHQVKNDNDDINLYGSVAASDRRLADVERIANDSTLSASYQILNQLHDWSGAIENDIQLSIKPRFYDFMINWLKPSLATAAIVTAVYFVAPEINNTSIQQPVNIVKSDRILLNSGFESDLINELSFDDDSSLQSDRISSINFG